jgi:hypothetical protein
MASGDLRSTSTVITLFISYIWVGLSTRQPLSCPRVSSGELTALYVDLGRSIRCLATSANGTIQERSREINKLSGQSTGNFGTQLIELSSMTSLATHSSCIYSSSCYSEVSPSKKLHTLEVSLGSRRFSLSMSSTPSL